MFIEFVSAHASEIVTAVMLIPVLAFSIALFLEGARKVRWPSARSRRAGALPSVAPAARRGPVSAMGAAGLRHGIAGRRDHD
jgi:hypothetical protein